MQRGRQCVREDEDSESGRWAHPQTLSSAWCYHTQLRPPQSPQRDTQCLGHSLANAWRPGPVRHTEMGAGLSFPLPPAPHYAVEAVRPLLGPRDTACEVSKSSCCQQKFI